MSRRASLTIGVESYLGDAPEGTQTIAAIERSDADEVRLGFTPASGKPFNVYTSVAAADALRSLLWDAVREEWKDDDE